VHVLTVCLGCWSVRDTVNNAMHPINCFPSQITASPLISARPISEVKFWDGIGIFPSRAVDDGSSPTCVVLTSCLAVIAALWRCPPLRMWRIFMARREQSHRTGRPIDTNPHKSMHSPGPSSWRAESWVEVMGLNGLK
jgi:hypothetical protein